ncbi:unknown [Porphyromonas sp. CAG:1061]|nr:unknown [Porphyromonas sp. CAG:1061]
MLNKYLPLVNTLRNDDRMIETFTKLNSMYVCINNLTKKSMKKILMSEIEFSALKKWRRMKCVSL